MENRNDYSRNKFQHSPPEPARALGTTTTKRANIPLMRFASKRVFIMFFVVLFALSIVIILISSLQPKLIQPSEGSPFSLCDLNHSGVCDETDKLIFTSSFGACRGEKTYNFNADIDGDGCVVTADEVNFLKMFETQNLSDNTILFEKQEGWGPCPPGDICRQSTKLFYSGELVLEGEKNTNKKLDAQTTSKIKNQFVASDIMNKDCSAGVVLDYYVIYTLNYEGRTKEIIFPGCEEELKSIEELFTF